MNPNELLNRVQVATPCSADWNQMPGDERRRFCQKCQKHVYNFAAMTSEETLMVIRETEGRLCGRLYVRRDGRVVTADCPMETPRYPLRARKFAAASIA